MEQRLLCRRGFRVVNYVDDFLYCLNNENEVDLCERKLYKILLLQIENQVNNYFGY